MEIISLREYCNNVDIDEKNKRLNYCAKKIFKCIEKYHSMGYVHKYLTNDSFQINSRTKEVYLQNNGTMTSFSYEYINIKKKYTDIYKINFANYDYQEYDYNTIYELSKNKYIHNGNMKYISHQIHDGYDYTPRDDLISLCYILLELKYNILPWSHLTCNNESQLNILYKNIKKYVNLKNYYLSISKDLINIFEKVDIPKCQFITMYYNLIYQHGYDYIDYNYIYSLLDI